MNAIEIALGHHRAGEFQQAETIYRTVIAQSPDHAQALQLLGHLCHQTQRLAEAERLFRMSIGLAPDWPATYFHLGVLLQNLGRYAESIPPLERVALLQPNAAETFVNLGDAYRVAGRMEDSIAALQNAIALAPALAEAHFNLVVTLQSLGRRDEAMAEYDRAIALRPEFAQAHLNRAILLLLLGDFERGLPEYEWRLPLLPRSTPAGIPPWRGENPAGKTILVDMEQGFGDAIQFSRYLPLLASRGARVILRCHESLVPLLKTLDGVETVLTFDQPPVGDAHVWMLSLPMLFGTRLDSIPAKTRYLHAEPDRVRHWRMRLDSASLNVGVCWSGSPGNPDNLNRSMPPEFLEPLAQVPDVRLISLQKSIMGPEPYPRPGKLPVTDWTNDLHDFADTAALIEALDLVISIDTATLHLAGALGKQAWGLIVFAPDWRYFLDRTDSPWYPAMRLFRQTQRADWKGVIERVSAELKGIVSHK